MSGEATSPVAQAPRAAGVLGPRYRVVTIAIVVTIAMFAFEEMAVSTAMPAAGADLGAGRAYGLAFSVLVTLQVLGTVLAGPWSDRAGPVPVVIAGLVVFTAGTALSAVSSAYPQFLAGRALTGLGTGLAIVALYVVIGRFYPATLRPRVFTHLSAAWVLPSLVGPPVAAWLTSSFSWRWVFGVAAAPALVVALAVAARSRAASSRAEEPDPAEHAGADTGAHTGARSRTRVVLLGVGISASAGLIQVGAAGLDQIASPAGALVVAGVAALLVTAPRALTPGTVTMRRGLASVMAARLVLMAAFAGTASFVPLMLTAERGTTLGTAGVVLTVGSIGWFSGAWVQGRQRWEGRRWQLVAGGGAALTAGLLGATAVAGSTAPWWLLGLAILLAGLGMGLATASTGVLALALSPVSEHGAASSSLQLADSLGNILGLSLASGVYAAMHVAAGADTSVYVVMWGTLTAVAALAVLAGTRSRVAVAPVAPVGP